MKTAVIALLFFAIFPLHVSASASDDLQQLLTEIKELQRDLKNSTASLLLIAKPMIENKDISETNHLATNPGTRNVVDKIYSDIIEKHQQASGLIHLFEAHFSDLSSGEKSSLNSLNQQFLKEKELIQKYLIYARHYFDTLSNIERESTESSLKNSIMFEGVASLKLGTASFEAGTKESSSSRNINLRGTININPKTNVNLGINHQNNVIRTPYTTNDLQLGVTHLTSNGGRVNGQLLFTSYDDKNIESNSFQDMGFGANIDYPFNEKMRFVGDVLSNSRSHDGTGNNDFNGTRFHSAVQFSGARADGSAGIRGRVQKSDISSLDYSRIIPNAQIRFNRNRNTFTLRGEYEQLAFDSTVESNDFNRGRIDLNWANRNRTTSFIYISKIFPNNQLFDSNTFRFQNRWTNSSGFRLNRTTFYMQFMQFTQNDARSSNFADIRYDRKSNSDSGYFDVNIYGRYWTDSDLDHQLNLFSRFGIKFSQFQIGPAVGAQISIDTDEFAFERAGNTLRAGLDARANAAVGKATIYASARYQRSIIYEPGTSADETSERNPITVELDGGLKVPITRAILLEVDATFFNIDLDFPMAAGMGIAQTQSGLRLLGGIRYQFNQSQFSR